MFVAIVLAVWYAYIAFLFVAPVAVGAVLIWRGRRRHKAVLVAAGVVCAVFPEAYYFSTRQFPISRTNPGRPGLPRCRA